MNFVVAKTLFHNEKNFSSQHLATTLSSLIDAGFFPAVISDDKFVANCLFQNEKKLLVTTFTDDFIVANIVAKYLPTIKSSLNIFRHGELATIFIVAKIVAKYI